MRTNLFIALFLTAGCALHAQPVLNSCGNSFQPGDMISGTQYTCDTTGFSVGSVGANVTWNFANLQSVSSSAYSETFATVASTPYAASFPNATIANVVGGNNYRYVSFTPSAYAYHGFNFNGQACNIYSDPLLTFPCPLNYGGSFTDTYAGSDCNSQNFSGTRGGTYEGYGTLIMPYATFQNIILLHNYDTLNANGLTTLFEYYIWFDQSANLGRLSATRVGLSILPGTTLTVDYVEITGGSVDNAQQDLAAAIQVYPNPASQSVQVDVPAQIGSGSFQLMDLNGKTILESGIQASQGEIELPAVPGGIYLYQIRDQRGNLLKAGKLAKE
jgi:hypothetical protein